MPSVRARFAVIIALVAATVVGGVLAAPADASRRRAAVRTISIDARDYSFDAPAAIPAGTVRLVLLQHGDEPHQAGLVRLKGDATSAEWLGALAQSFTAADRVGTFVPGPNTSSPGRSSSVTVNLRPGRYAIVCLIPSPADGTPHIVKGMMRDLTVTGTARARRLPRARTVTLRNYSFGVPRHLRTGETVTVVNRGRESHEMVVVRMKPGTSIQDLVRWDHPAFQPEPFPQPYEDVTGVTPMAPGMSARVTLPARPGRYVLVCFIPDARNRSHLERGMIHPITLH